MPEAKSLLSSEVKVNISAFSERIRAAKNKSGLSDANLGKLLNVSDKTVRAWINDTSEPRMQRRKEIEAQLTKILSEEPQGETAEPEIPSKPETNPEEFGIPDKLEDPKPDRPRLRELLPGDRRWDL